MSRPGDPRLGRRPGHALLSLCCALGLAAGCTPDVSPADPPACNSSEECPEGQFCSGGTCQPVTNDCAPFASCPGGCADLSSDAGNCGACGVACEGGCLASSCCPPAASTVCGGACADTASDPANCGACGTRCGPGESCLTGLCCAEGSLVCDGACADPRTDPDHCGGCGVRCALGAACAGGACEGCPAPLVEASCDGVPACVPDASCMLLVPAGPFLMGSAEPGSGDGPQHEVTLSAYRIDLFEATVARYDACVAAGACEPPELFDPVGKRAFPVGWLSWEMASALCSFEGKRLPTEAEWERAARGTDARRWPWGEEEPGCDRAMSLDCPEDGLQPVGGRRRGTSPVGALDLSGNAGEWCSDWHAGESYTTGPFADPQGPASGTHRSFRGGSYQSDPVTKLSTTFRGHMLPEEFGPGYGVRCAAPP